MSPVGSSHLGNREVWLCEKLQRTDRMTMDDGVIETGIGLTVRGPSMSEMSSDET